MLVLSNEVFNARSGTVIAVAITSQPPSIGFPLYFELEHCGLPKRSWAKLGQIRTLAVERMGKRLGMATPEQLHDVMEGVNEILG